MSWGKREQASGGKFLKLKDGEAVTGVFRGSPRIFYVVWKNNRSQEVGQGTAGSAFKFESNFVVNENGAMTAKVISGGGGFYDQVVALIESGFDIEKTVVRVAKTGTGKETKYTVTPTPKQLTESQEAQLQAVELHDLNPRVTTQSERVYPEGFDPTDE